MPIRGPNDVSSETYHEPIEAISEPARDLHRAISSLMEELEAVDWYQQRVEATSDAELAAILAHNRDEEIEHAMMVLEWLRRRSPKFAAEMKTYLFTEGPITAIEASDGEGEGEGDAEPAPAAEPSSPSSLGIGSLKQQGAR